MQMMPGVLPAYKKTKGHAAVKATATMQLIILKILYISIFYTKNRIKASEIRGEIYDKMLIFNKTFYKLS